jgi:hypothetical protein
VRPYLEKTHSTKRAGKMAQSVGSEFTLQYSRKKKGCQWLPLVNGSCERKGFTFYFTFSCVESLNLPIAIYYYAAADLHPEQRTAEQLDRQPSAVHSCVFPWAPLHKAALCPRTSLTLCLTGSPCGVCRVLPPPPHPQLLKQ